MRRVAIEFNGICPPGSPSSQVLPWLCQQRPLPGTHPFGAAAAGLHSHTVFWTTKGSYKYCRSVQGASQADETLVLEAEADETEPEAGLGDLGVAVGHGRMLICRQFRQCMARHTRMHTKTVCQLESGS